MFVFKKQNHGSFFRGASDFPPWFQAFLVEGVQRGLPRGVQVLPEFETQMTAQNRQVSFDGPMTLNHITRPKELCRSSPPTLMSSLGFSPCSHTLTLHNSTICSSPCIIMFLLFWKLLPFHWFQRQLLSVGLKILVFTRLCSGQCSVMPPILLYTNTRPVLTSFRTGRYSQETP